MNWDKRPFAVTIDLEAGVVTPAEARVTRLSDLEGLFVDEEAYRQEREKGDLRVYTVYSIPVPEERGQLLSCTTILYPGKVGKEYYMTRGHFHLDTQAAEVYTCLSGEGYLLLVEDGSGEAESIKVVKGTSVYVPARWAHRMVNCGKIPLVFYAVWPAEAGHDYERLREKGFPLRVFEEGERPSVVRLG